MKLYLGEAKLHTSVGFEAKLQWPTLKNKYFNGNKKSPLKYKKRKNYRALPRGNTSSGNTKRSCGWS